MPAITCTIITLNEGDRLGRTLASVADIADEIVVVDSGSNDDTVAVAERAGARVVVHPFKGYGPQKRVAEDEASHDWVLNVDADEVLTAELQREIAAWKREDPEFAGYRFRQVTVYPGAERPRWKADYHNYIRLYDRRKMRFRTSLVHDTVDEGDHAIGQLVGECWHWSWRSLDHLARKLNGYTNLQAKELRKPRWLLHLRRPVEYPFLLLRYLFLKAHITGGWYGVRSAHIFARERAKRVGRILQAQKGEKVG